MYIHNQNNNPIFTIRALQRRIRGARGIMLAWVPLGDEDSEEEE